MGGGEHELCDEVESLFRSLSEKKNVSSVNMKEHMEPKFNDQRSIDTGSETESETGSVNGSETGSVNGYVNGNLFDLSELYCDEYSNILKAKKVSIPLQFRITKEKEIIHTKEGMVSADAGTYIMTGTNNENWPILEKNFHETYRVMCVPFDEWLIKKYNWMILLVFVFFCVVYINNLYVIWSMGMVFTLELLKYINQHPYAIAKYSKYVYAKKMKKDFYVTVSWNKDCLYGKAGDWLLQYGSGVGDYGVVDKDIFKKTYIIVS